MLIDLFFLSWNVLHSYSSASLCRRLIYWQEVPCTQTLSQVAMIYIAVSWLRRNTSNGLMFCKIRRVKRCHFHSHLPPFCPYDEWRSPECHLPEHIWVSLFCQGVIWRQTLTCKKRKNSSSSFELFVLDCSIVTVTDELGANSVTLSLPMCLAAFLNPGMLFALQYYCNLTLPNHPGHQKSLGHCRAPDFLRHFLGNFLPLGQQHSSLQSICLNLKTLTNLPNS